MKIQILILGFKGLNYKSSAVTRSATLPPSSNWRKGKKL